jgi:Tfp pilus assembly protein PilN
MIEINLLPKDYRKKSFSLSLGKTGVYSLIAAAGIVVMLIGVTFYQMHQLTTLDDNISKAQQRAAMLQKDIAIVDALTDVKGKINRRITAVDKLDGHRSSWVRVLEDLTRNVPEFVWLVKLDQEGGDQQDTRGKARGNQKEEEPEQEVIPPGSSRTPEVIKVSVEGYAFTLNALATFMINMMRSDYFDEVELTSTEEKFLDNEKEHKAFNFVLTSNLHYLSDEQLRNMVAQAAPGDTSKGSQAGHKVLN